MNYTPLDEDMGKPSWANAPDWANWLGKDSESNGEFIWYELKPYTVFTSEGARRKTEGNYLLSGFYSNSDNRFAQIEPRPMSFGGEHPDMITLREQMDEVYNQIEKENQNDL